MIADATALLQQSYFSFSMDRSVTLAGFVILKLVRSPVIAPYIDLAAGEQAFFQAVQFLKSVSLQPTDIYVRTALIMSDLWSSNKVFRKKNGQIESLGLRLRTRLGMSVSYDMFWYWREEFGNMKNPYSGEENTTTSNEATRPTTPREQAVSNPGAPLLTGSAQPQMQPQQMPAVTMNPQIPMTKFDPSLVQIQPEPSVMSFDTWDGSDYNVPPVMDQFPDYDWAAGFDFSNTDFPTLPTGAMGAPLVSNNMGNMGNMGFTFG